MSLTQLREGNAYVMAYDCASKDSVHQSAASSYFLLVVPNMRRSWIIDKQVFRDLGDNGLHFKKRGTVKCEFCAGDKTLEDAATAVDGFRTEFGLNNRERQS